LGAALTEEAYKNFVNASLARATWGKYASGWRAFCQFEVFHQSSFAWPLSVHVWRAFAVWCVTVRKLQPSSTRSFISALKFVHMLKGLPCEDTVGDTILKIILKGAANTAFSLLPRPQTRRVVTLPLLLTLGHSIRRSAWPEQAKQVG